MKQYEFNLTQFEIDKFFIAIRDKRKIIEILMNAIKHMRMNPQVQPEKIKGKLILKIDDMKRLFFYSEKKFFSISFPFSVEEKEDSYTFFSNEVSDINGFIISKVISIINSDEFENTNCLDFIEPIHVFDEYSDELFWVFFKKLLLSEPGYIRYDIDIENFKKYLEKGEPEKHPEHHYDVFYSDNNTFKIGLDKKMQEIDFIDFLDINTNCKFLKI